jgi:hypothetical protein
LTNHKRRATIKTMKARETKKYEYTAVKLPLEIKRKVRLVAATKETSMAEAACFLLQIGLEHYEAHA